MRVTVLLDELRVPFIARVTSYFFRIRVTNYCILHELRFSKVCLLQFCLIVLNMKNVLEIWFADNYETIKKVITEVKINLATISYKIFDTNSSFHVN